MFNRLPHACVKREKAGKPPAVHKYKQSMKFTGVNHNIAKLFLSRISDPQSEILHFSVKKQEYPQPGTNLSRQ